MLVAVGLALAVKVALSGPDSFLGPSLFPIWSALESERAIRLFILSMGVLLTPKFLGWTAAEVNLRRSRAFGGPVLLTLSARAESFLSALYAPVLMLVQTQFVWQVLHGGDRGWKPQRRGDGGMTLRDTLRVYFWHATIGLSAALGAWAINGGLFLWTLPVTGALILSPVTSWLSGRKYAGVVLQRLGILRTPEERGNATHRILADRRAYFPWGYTLLREQNSLAALANDPGINAWHRDQLANVQERPAFEPSLFVARAKAERETDAALLSDWLTPPEKRAFCMMRS